MPVKCVKCKLKQPCFNLQGEKTALYCGSCAKLININMVDVKNKKCKCGKARPYFNEPGQTKPICCGSCKTTTMINVKDKRCKCGKARPTYNEPGQTKPICCSYCKTTTMINVISKKCKCGKTQPTYNEPGQTKPICCSSCKTTTMINVKSKKCKCGKAIPTYNEPEETKPICCSSCKTTTMINVKDKRCKTEWCDTLISNKKYKGYCLFCFMNLFPDEKVSRNYKTKEISVRDYIKTEFPDIDWICDKQINNGCSKKRPDLLLDLGYQVLIIEIDENQHNNYDCSCENKRLMELSQDLNHRPIVFIRFNPDDYLDNNKNITSCWGPDGNGICCVKKSKKREWNERLNILKDTVNYWINEENKTNKTIEVIELFYDRN